jgi:hypothetical protein
MEVVMIARTSVRLALLALLLPIAAAAQEPATITGRVTRQDGAPLQGAVVRIPSLAVNATTDAEGAFTIVVPGARADGGEHRIIASKPRYAAQSHPITVPPGAGLVQDFRLVSPGDRPAVEP